MKMKKQKLKNYITLAILIAVVIFFYVWTMLKATIFGV